MITGQPHNQPDRPTVDPDTPLSADLASYVLYRSVADSTRRQMRSSLVSVDTFLRRPATRADLNDETISRWIQWMGTQYAPRTTYGYRRTLLTLWKDLSAQGFVPPHCRIRRAPKPPPCPVAWTIDELQNLLTRIRELPGCFPNGVPRALYTEALVRVAYDSGLRRADVWNLDRNNIRPDGSINMRMRKTGFAHNPRLRPETLALVNKLPGRFPLACPYAKRFGWEWYWKHYVTAKAGVRHGGMQQLRRTAATHLAREHPESVTRFLGHRCPEMAQHYIDWSIAAPMSHLPPALPEAKPAPKTLNGNGSQKQQRTPAGQFGALHD